jgi:heterotetrameric sarcosine oxidase gamma subunit
MTATFKSPITKTYAPMSGAALTLTDESAQAKVIVRAAAGTPARAALAQAFAGSRTADGVLIAGTRPDEWMLIGDVAAVRAHVDGLSTDGHVSIVDWTHGRAQFRLTGAVASSALEKICGLDWSDAMMPDGAVTSGSVAKVTCDLIRNDVDDQPSYLVLVDRSFGQYLFDTIIDSGDEFGISATA